MLFSSEYIAKYCIEEVELGSTLWEFKHTVETIKRVELGDKYVYSAQYQQDPSPAGGGMFKDKYWKYYEILPADIDLIVIFCDTAQKTSEQNDYTVYQCWARSRSKGIYLVDQLRGKWEAPQIESKLVDFWNKHKPTIYKPLGASLIMVEDKSSGSSLIQSIQDDYLIPIEPIQRNTDKVLRAMGVVKYLAAGFIHLPIDVDWIHDYKEEFRKFTPLMTHAHDDQIDPTVDAIERLIVFDGLSYTSDAINN